MCMNLAMPNAQLFCFGNVHTQHMTYGYGCPMLLAFAYPVLCCARVQLMRINSKAATRKLTNVIIIVIAYVFVHYVCAFQ